MQTGPAAGGIVLGLLIERTREDPSRRVRQVPTHLLGPQPYEARTGAALQALLAQEKQAVSARCRV
jgi:hypothetical protein